MSGQVQLLSYAAAVFTALLIKEAEGVSTSCEMITTATSGELICTFGEDIASSEQDFAVQRYDLDKDDLIPDSVLMCSWQSDGLKCVAQKGYSFNRSVSNTLTLTIPVLTQKHEGRYLCQVTSNDDKNDKFCSYKHPLEPPKPGLSRPNSPVNDKETDHYREAVIVLTVFLVIFIFVTAGLAAALIIRRKGPCKGTENKIKDELKSLGDRMERNFKEDGRNTRAKMNELGKTIDERLKQMEKKIYEASTNSSAVLLKHFSQNETSVESANSKVHSPVADGSTTDSKFTTVPEVHSDGATEADPLILH